MVIIAIVRLKTYFLIHNYCHKKIYSLIFLTIRVLYNTADKYAFFERKDEHLHFLKKSMQNPRNKTSCLWKIIHRIIQGNLSSVHGNEAQWIRKYAFSKDFFYFYITCKRSRILSSICSFFLKENSIQVYELYIQICNSQESDA